MSCRYKSRQTVIDSSSSVSRGNSEIVCYEPSVFEEFCSGGERGVHPGFCFVVPLIILSPAILYISLVCKSIVRKHKKLKKARRSYIDVKTKKTVDMTHEEWIKAITALDSTSLPKETQQHLNLPNTVQKMTESKRSSENNEVDISSKNAELVVSDGNLNESDRTVSKCYFDDEPSTQFKTHKKTSTKTNVTVKRSPYQMKLSLSNPQVPKRTTKESKENQKKINRENIETETDEHDWISNLPLTELVKRTTSLKEMGNDLLYGDNVKYNMKTPQSKSKQEQEKTYMQHEKTKDPPIQRLKNIKSRMLKANNGREYGIFSQGYHDKASNSPDSGTKKTMRLEGRENFISNGNIVGANIQMPQRKFGTECKTYDTHHEKSEDSSHRKWKIMKRRMFDIDIDESQERVIHANNYHKQAAHSSDSE